MEEFSRKINRRSFAIISFFSASINHNILLDPEIHKKNYKAIKHYWWVNWHEKEGHCYSLYRVSVSIGDEPMQLLIILHSFSLSKVWCMNMAFSKLVYYKNFKVFFYLESFK